MTGADGRRIDRTGSRKIFFSASGLLLIKNVSGDLFYSAIRARRRNIAQTYRNLAIL